LPVFEEETLTTNNIFNEYGYGSSTIDGFMIMCIGKWENYAKALERHRTCWDSTGKSPARASN
jgi:hypothetical protein